MLQEIKMSRKEKIKFYREIKKLAEMLYECNRQLDLLLENRGNGYRSNPVDTGMSPSNGTNAEYNYIWFKWPKEYDVHMVRTREYHN